MKKEYILCAAILINNNIKNVHQPKNVDIGYVICGRRHHNCFATLMILNVNYNESKVVQGFITSDDRFVDRTEGLKIANEANQIKTSLKPDDKLISEELY